MLNTYTKIINNRNNTFAAVFGIVCMLVAIGYYQADKQQYQYKLDRAIYEAAQAELEQGQPARALERIQQTSPDFQKNWTVAYFYGFTYANLQEYDKADSYLQQAEDLAPILLTRSEFLTQRGKVLMQLKQKDQALEYLNHALELASTEDESLNIKALINQATLGIIIEGNQ